MGLVETITSAAAAGASVGGGLFSGHANRKMVRQQNALNREFAHDEAELAYNREVEQWQRENAYNTPSAQMARYAAAGLNPNLVYSQGDFSGASSSSAPMAATPDTSVPRYDNPLSGVNDALTNFQRLATLEQNRRMNDSEIAKNAAEANMYDAYAAQAGANTNDINEHLDYFRAVRDIREAGEALGLKGEQLQQWIGFYQRKLLEQQVKGLKFQNEIHEQLGPTWVEQAAADLQYTNALTDNLRKAGYLTDEEAKRARLYNEREALYNNVILPWEENYLTVNNYSNVGGFLKNKYEDSWTLLRNQGSYIGSQAARGWFAHKFEDTPENLFLQRLEPFLSPAIGGLSTGFGFSLFGGRAGAPASLSSKQKAAILGRSLGDPSSYDVKHNYPYSRKDHGWYQYGKYRYNW